MLRCSLSAERYYGPLPPSTTTRTDQVPERSQHHLSNRRNASPVSRPRFMTSAMWYAWFCDAISRLFSRYRMNGGPAGICCLVAALGTRRVSCSVGLEFRSSRRSYGACADRPRASLSSIATSSPRIPDRFAACVPLQDQESLVEYLVLVSRLWARLNWMSLPRFPQSASP